MPKQVIVVGKLEINNLLSVGEGDNGCCCSRGRYGCVGAVATKFGEEGLTLTSTLVSE